MYVNIGFVCIILGARPSTPAPRKGDRKGRPGGGATVLPWEGSPYQYGRLLLLELHVANQLR
jgi:hypothetical protein